MNNHYIVSYETENYDQRRSYFRNQNRHAQYKHFDNVEAALAFAEECKIHARRTYIKVRDYNRGRNIVKFVWNATAAAWN